MARIEISWFKQVFRNLRDNKVASRELGGPLSYPESSHLVAMMAQAGLVSVIGRTPIQITATELFHSCKDKELIRKIRQELQPGVGFITPVHKAESVVIDWTNDNNGNQIVRYGTLGTHIFKKNAENELERIRHQAEVSQRPGQLEFSTRIRTNYGGKCAFSGCKMSAALQAAHVRIIEGHDANALDNGILLRSDVHALLDAYLITFNRAGTRLKTIRAFQDETYNLDNVKIAEPIVGPKLSSGNIEDHRKRFKAAEAKRK